MNPTKAVPSNAELQTKLTKDQYHVTRECGTETPFQNAYWDNHRAGIYVDIITGEPLFSSLDKFDSGTGWPSFTKPISKDKVVEKRDSSHGMERTEVRSSKSDSHLGHLFDDGPAPTGQRRAESRKRSINSRPGQARAFTRGQKNGGSGEGPLHLPLIKMPRARSSRSKARTKETWCCVPATVPSLKRCHRAFRLQEQE